MTPIDFHNVTFAYPVDDIVSGDDTATGDGAPPEPVFSEIELAFPQRFTFLVGPNGIGKSTLMLLAAARLFPQEGTITIGGRDTREFINAGFEPALEAQRNELVSFVYQNMEFETEETIDELFSLVAANGADPERAGRVREELISAAGLMERLGARMHELSKGEMQRAIIVMSVLYASPVIMMDEPVFAVEPDRAERLFAWLKEYCADGATDIYTSVHDVKLAERFADAVILMHTDGTIEAGDPTELLSRTRLEIAFRAPYDTLYQRQNLYRELLNKSLGDEARR
ncbi:MAG: ATP-binding cassette domain-containing protein [Alkalispirochaeta sp.]